MESTRKDRFELRVVVQYSCEAAQNRWHLIAYGGGRAYTPRTFMKVEDLLAVICSAVPNFDPQGLVLERDPDQRYVAWAGDLSLTKGQMVSLGLMEDPLVEQ